MEDVFAFLAPALQLIAPQPCYDEFFVKFNFLDGRCHEKEPKTERLREVWLLRQL